MEELAALWMAYFVPGYLLWTWWAVRTRAVRDSWRLALIVVGFPVCLVSSFGMLFLTHDLIRRT